MNKLKTLVSQYEELRNNAQTLQEQLAYSTILFELKKDGSALKEALDVDDTPIIDREDIENYVIDNHIRCEELYCDEEIIDYVCCNLDIENVYDEDTIVDYAKDCRELIEKDEAIDYIKDNYCLDDILEWR